VPPHNWVPLMAPAITPDGRLFIPGPGGTIYYVNNPDDDGATLSGQLAFYGIENYGHDLDGTIYVNTPLTVSSNGNLYYAFQVTGSNRLGLTNGGIVNTSPDGTSNWVTVQTASGDNNILKAAPSSALALSNDETTLYVEVKGNGRGYLLALDSSTLAQTGRVQLFDPRGGVAGLSDDSTASPMVGPDGDVYIGILENPFPSNHDRGWMLHFSADLTQTK